VGEDSKIEWTHHTFNPWWGCVKVSPACDRCYAESFSRRVGFSDTGAQFPIWGKDSSRRFFGDKHWAEPVKWNRDAEKAGERRRVFCASMADVMEDRQDLNPSRVRLYNLIDDTPWLDWLLLTKRPQNFRRFLPKTWLKEPRPNVWGMTTVESDEYHWRAFELLKTPFVIRGLSVEPLLAPLDLDKYELVCRAWRHGFTIGTYLDWVIVGGESGHGARPMNPQWVRSIRNQCVAAGVAFHFKQWGEHAPVSGAAFHIAPPMEHVGKKKAGRILDGRTWDEMPAVTNG
jgi:protein gp37